MRSKNYDLTFLQGVVDMCFSRTVPDNPELFTHKRTLLRLDKAGVNNLREMVRVNFTAQDSVLNDHIHPDAMEICYYAKGTQVYRVRGVDYHLKGGMVFVTYPNEVHSSGDQRQEKGGQLFYMIIDTVNGLDNFLGFEGDEARRLADALNKLPRTFHVESSMKALYDELFELYISKPFCWQTRLRCCAFNLLCELVKYGRRNANSNVSRDIILALEYIEDHIYDAGKISIELIARHANFSVPQFTQRFLCEIGVPPGKYINRRRMEIARQMLDDGHRITEIAFKLGFASSQHFSSFFRAYNGCSPTQWRKSQERQ